MVEVGGMPILWHIMKIYAAHGVDEFLICLGYRGYMIKEFFANYFLHSADVTIDLANNKIDRSRGQERAVEGDAGRHRAHRADGRAPVGRAPLPHAGEPFCFTYGDGVSDIDITAELAFHRAHGKGHDRGCHAAGPLWRAGIPRRCGGGFQEKPAGDGGQINGGFFVLDPAIDLIAGPDTGGRITR
jgi:glucose-1-phosphate cytidylyltransferase